MSCGYCKTIGDGSENIDLKDIIDLENQNFEARLNYDKNWKSVLEVDSTLGEFKIQITYCPFCGRKLKKEKRWD